jgi:predicted phosphoribosyltransferase
MHFQHRREAGQRLGAHLQAVLGPRDDVVVLGIPRGGVVVARPVAEALRAPLDVIIPRKIGAPGNPELAIGAVAAAGAGDIVVVDERSLKWMEVPEAYVREEAARQRQEIERRQAVYRQGRAPLPVEGRTVVVVDDGLATGLTARAALSALERLGPREVVLAVPVAPKETVAEFRARGLRIEALETPAPFIAVGRFYADFEPVEDEEVLAVLAAPPVPE